MIELNDAYALAGMTALLLMVLFGGHAIADYGLQSAYMAAGKVRAMSPKNAARLVQRTGKRPPADPAYAHAPAANPDWFVTLSAHCLIHGFMVAVASVTFMLAAGLAPQTAVAVAALLAWTETVVHFLIDDAKGQQLICYRTDQALHYGCKVVWTAMIAFAAF